MKRSPRTVYRGQRLYDGQHFAGVRITIDHDEATMGLLFRSLEVARHATSFEWGYSGAGPTQLALALILDVTGNVELARDACRWFRWCEIVHWHKDEWMITAGKIRRWLDQWRREERAPSNPHHHVRVPRCGPVRSCRVCGCTDDDCRQCYAATGGPCTWVEGEDPPICSRCADQEDAALVVEMNGGAE